HGGQQGPVHMVEGAKRAISSRSSCAQLWALAETSGGLHKNCVGGADRPRPRHPAPCTRPRGRAATGFVGLLLTFCQSCSAVQGALPHLLLCHSSVSFFCVMYVVSEPV